MSDSEMSPASETSDVERLVMCFSMTHDLFGTVKSFDENTAPDWLTSVDTVKGSTMDMRWFWKDKVLTLPVGGTTQTDFQTIVRTR